jgi:precorrin-2 dehydrogenase / sirohydrochlorin ferrochelatase
MRFMPDHQDTPRPLYPVELNLAGRPVVVVGGGGVAERKVAGLVEAGAAVRIVSRSFTAGLAERSDVTRVTGPYESSVLEGAVLVFACTDDPEVNARVAADASGRGIWCNVADDPELSDLLVPATVCRGRLTVAVGTGGAAPLLAASIRDRLASNLGAEYGILVDELGRARLIVQERIADPQVRREIFRTLCQDCSLKLLAARDREEWRSWFERVMAHRLLGKPGDPPAE